MGRLKIFTNNSCITVKLSEESINILFEQIETGCKFFTIYNEAGNKCFVMVDQIIYMEIEEID